MQYTTCGKAFEEYDTPVQMILCCAQIWWYGYMPCQNLLFAMISEHNLTNVVSAAFIKLLVHFVCIALERRGNLACNYLWKYGCIITFELLYYVFGKVRHNYSPKQLNTKRTIKVVDFLNFLKFCILMLLKLCSPLLNIGHYVKTLLWKQEQLIVVIFQLNFFIIKPAAALAPLFARAASCIDSDRSSLVNVDT